MPVNEFKFGLNDVKIATWNSAQNYGTAVDVESVQLYGIDIQSESGTLEGDDIITDVAAKSQSINVRLRFAFKDLDVYAILTGVTNTDSTTNQSMIFARDKMPYWAICGRVDGTAITGGGDTTVFIPKCKLMEGLSLSMEKGTYVTPEINAMAVYEGTTYGMMKVINNGTAQSVTIPPVGAS